MKYIKKFESINEGEPQVADYVIVEKSKMLFAGRIYSKYSNYFYVKYELPDGRKSNDIFYSHEIKYWSKNKEELEIYLNTNKYNI